MKIYIIKCIMSCNICRAPLISDCDLRFICWLHGISYIVYSELMKIYIVTYMGVRIDISWMCTQHVSAYPEKLPDRLNLGQTCLNCRCFSPHCLWRTPRSTIQGVLDVSVMERLPRQSHIESWRVPANGRRGGAGSTASLRQSELLVMLGSPGESALDTIALRDYSEWVCYKQLDLRNS